MWTWWYISNKINWLNDVDNNRSVHATYMICALNLLYSQTLKIKSVKYRNARRVHCWKSFNITHATTKETCPSYHVTHIISKINGTSYCEQQVEESCLMCGVTCCITVLYVDLPLLTNDQVLHKFPQNIVVL